MAELLTPRRLVGRCDYDHIGDRSGIAPSTDLDEICTGRQGPKLEPLRLPRDACCHGQDLLTVHPVGHRDRRFDHRQQVLVERTAGG
jgi:hypothetical protein